MYKLKYRRRARNYLARLPLKTKTAIVKKLHALCLSPDSTTLDIDALKGGEGFRLRLGQYRVIYTRDDDYFIIEVVKVRTRGDIYKR
jgi:mRNA interferase RelE/StbE